MIPKECKRLAEVDFPIAEVSRHSAREKSIRHGHPSTLHLWWARRPLAACRAMLLGLLLPDPCDPHCPEAFKENAREALLRLPGRPAKWDEDSRTDKGLREIILKFIADFANWDLSADRHYLEASRALVRAAYPEEPPLVVDPFAGGGSIPLEALRLGCEAFASDLNPVACLILKVMLEDIPRHGPKLAEELRQVGSEIKRQAEAELAGFYPNDPDGAKPIAYLWARTVRCESPNCGAEIPLVRSFWLCKKANRKRALRHRVIRPESLSHLEKKTAPLIEFDIFEPRIEGEVSIGTVTRAKATCLACGGVLPPERVRTQLAAQRGGADVIFDPSHQHSPNGRGGEGIANRIGGARMLAVVTLQPGEQGRHYRLPTERDYDAVWKAQHRLKEILDEWERGGRKGLCPVPDEPTPAGGGSGAGRAFSVQKYGMMKFGDIFTARQKLALAMVARAISDQKDESTREILANVMGRCADYWSSGVVWAQEGEFVAHTFSRQALPLVWDYAECVPWTDSSGNFNGAVNWVSAVVEAIPKGTTNGQSSQADALESSLPDQSSAVWFTDPPYYDAIPYSDLSDFFFVWLKRALPGHRFLRDPFDPANQLTPKTREAVQDEIKKVNGRAKDRTFFEETMAKAFAEGCRVLKQDGIGSVVFAHKTTEGWEALLSGMIRGGWVITGSWPIATERPGRLRSQDSAALATSVHLICRPRPEDAPIGDWGEVLRELPGRVGDWMERLQGEGIRGADLVFACIGPALEIFSRYSRVETAEGREVKLAEYLEKVWEVVGRTALEQVLGTAEARARNGMAGVLEEDARLTALFLWTLQATNGQNGSSDARYEEMDENSDDEDAAPRGKAKGYSLIFDVVRRFAQPLGIDLPRWEGRIIKTEKGVVRLLPVSERVKQLFGTEGVDRAADWIKDEPEKIIQLSLFPIQDERGLKIQGKNKGRRRMGIDLSNLEIDAKHEATTLDRVHAAMLLQKGGQTNALRTLIKAEQERGSNFMRLANSLSALYPSGSEERRLLEAMTQAVPR